eukprot:6440338-Alexandrium_andersonii.AAC.1
MRYSCAARSGPAGARCAETGGPGRLLQRRRTQGTALRLASEACAGRATPVARRRRAEVRGRQA